MNQESTDAPPSVPDEFQGIMDPNFNQVHQDIYGDGDVDIPLPTPADVDTQAVAWPVNNTYEKVQARQFALERAILVAARLNLDSDDAIIATAQKFADFLSEPLT